MAEVHPGVMVVDDDTDSRDAIEHFLRIFGYDPIAAANGRDALDQLHAGCRPGVILLDLRMPVMDGWEFVAEVSRDPGLSDIPIAVATAASQASLPSPPRSAGVFYKPIFLPQLLSVVRAHCG